MDPLSDKHKQILDYIEKEVERCNYPPSVREICKALGIKSTATVHHHLDALEKKGYISRMRTMPRAIEIIRDSSGQPTKKCGYAPLIGRITAGAPILAEENLEGFFPIPLEITAGEDCFVLKVSGDSMIGAGILDGDYVIVKQQKSAENGDIVAALLGEEATVKRFYREGKTVKLLPENDAYEPIITEEAEILGRVAGLYRHIY